MLCLFVTLVMGALFCIFFTFVIRVSNAHSVYLCDCDFSDVISFYYVCDCYVSNMCSVVLFSIVFVMHSLFWTLIVSSVMHAC